MRPHVFIGVASRGGYWKDASVFSLVLAVKSLGCEITLGCRAGPYTHWNRADLLSDALEVGASHLMFVDTDVTYPAHGVGQLLAHGKHIVGGMYNVKSLPPLNTIKMANDAGEIIAMPGDQIPRELFRCAAVPGGFLLAELEPMRDGRFCPPYFTCERETGGEDVFFCRKAAASGLEVWCDPTIEIGHIGDYTY